MALPEFADDPQRGGEKVLEAIQAAWIERPSKRRAPGGRVENSHRDFPPLPPRRWWKRCGISPYGLQGHHPARRYAFHSNPRIIRGFPFIDCLRAASPADGGALRV